MLYVIPAVSRSGSMKVCYPIKQRGFHRVFPPLWGQALHAAVDKSVCDKYEGDAFYSHTNVVDQKGATVSC